jgi:hypothetical protein
VQAAGIDASIGCFESKLTRRANHRHSFIIPQSLGARRPALTGAAIAIAAEKSSSTLEMAPDRRGERLPARGLEQDGFSSNRHLALSFCLSMIFSENRSPLFRIML